MNRTQAFTSRSASSEYSFGIEEEFFISRLSTRDTFKKTPAGFIADCQRDDILHESVASELLQSQVEVATPVMRDMAAALPQLQSYRAALARIGATHELGIMAAGTHPNALWVRQRQTDALRYDRLMQDLQMLGARNMVCGLHVHVGVPDPERRVGLMVRMIPFIPLLLALSTSSPFWQARRTGLMGYRLAAYDELPRTGIPELFANSADYDQYIATLTAAGAITDASFVWWAVRPSLAHPTLELRVADSCTYAEDAVAIAALFRALVRRLDRDPALNAGLDATGRAIAVENKWRAQRYGIHGSFVSAEKRRAVSVHDTLEDVLAIVRDDARALDCQAEVDSARQILTRGTSADRQLEIYRYARSGGGARSKSLGCVVDWLVAATLQGPGTDLRSLN